MSCAVKQRGRRHLLARGAAVCCLLVLLVLCLSLLRVQCLDVLCVLCFGLLRMEDTVLATHELLCMPGQSSASLASLGVTVTAAKQEPKEQAHLKHCFKLCVDVLLLDRPLVKL